MIIRGVRMSLAQLVRNEDFWRQKYREGFPKLRGINFTWAEIAVPSHAATEAQISALCRRRDFFSSNIEVLLQEVEAERCKIAAYFNAKPEEVFSRKMRQRHYTQLLFYTPSRPVTKSSRPIRSTIQPMQYCGGFRIIAAQLL